MRRSLSLCCCFVLLSVAATGFAVVDRPTVKPPPAFVLGLVPAAEPMVLSSGGDTTWLQVHDSTSYCPGDPNLGHGGETSGGPGSLETWCFEGGPGDSCGTNPPWDTNCFKHVDVRAMPSNMNINYWHVDSYRTDQRAYCGSRALWCGSPSVWAGDPVECGTWEAPPGYGDSWYCLVELDLPSSFDVAGGCTLHFDPRYDTECKYDYFYVDYLSVGPAPTYKQTWKPLAAFNATSSNPGATCGGSASNPDYWANTDVNRLVNCDWQDRSAGTPAFRGVITPAMFGTCVNAPKLRWRFASDASASDADGRIDTDGAAFVDNVMVCGDAGDFYSQDFETCSVYGPLPEYWSAPSPAGVLDAWYFRHDTDPPLEGGDGGDRTTCVLDSSYTWRARPEAGYPAGKAWSSGWYYRLMTPRVPITNTGCVVQYDDYHCFYDYTCDFYDIKVRFYDDAYDTWCPWTRIYGGTLLYGGCFYWNFDVNTDVSAFYGGTADSMQFAWELMDFSLPTWICRGKHSGTQYLVDNVSVGFYDGHATSFYTRGIDLLDDTFETGVCGYNSFFDSYSPDTVAKYSGPGAPPLPKEQQFNVDVIDEDHLSLVQLRGSIDGGSNWITMAMSLDEPADYFNPAHGGLYYGTLCPGNFGLTEWAEGTEVWYYVKATDALNNVEYHPATADPAHPRHSGTVEDYLEFSILPMFPPDYAGPKIVLVDGHPRDVYDYAPCLGATDNSVLLENLYEQTLTDAGYCFDKYDISGAGSATQNQPIEYADYDAVVWFTGPYSANHLFDAEAQHAIDDYLADGGKVVVCGDRVAYNLYYMGEDSLGGCFLGGVLGAEYLNEEMPSAFDYPYFYSVGVDSLDVLGSRIAIGLDTTLVYRSCPYLKDMSYVRANAGAGACGYTAQALMYIANPTVAQADEVMYSEHTDGGQCVFVNFDLSASVNHTRGYCSGNAADPAPDFNAGTYDGRVELVRVILEDIFGLPSSGGAGVPQVPALDGGAGDCWALGQNTPNPCVSRTQISYEVARAGTVRIRIHDATGRLISTLVDDHKQPGRYIAAWDGANGAGEHVSSGVYFYTMEAAGYKATKKMLVVQ